MTTYIVLRIGEFPEFMGQFDDHESAYERAIALVAKRERKSWSAGLPIYLISIEDGIYMNTEKF